MNADDSCLSMRRGHSCFWWTGEYRQRIEYPRLSVSSAADCFFQVIVPLSRLSRPRVKSGSCAPDSMQPATRKSTRRLASQTRECGTQFRIGNISGHGFQQLASTRGDCPGPLSRLPASPKVERCGAHLKADQLPE